MPTVGTNLITQNKTRDGAVGKLNVAGFSLRSKFHPRKIKTQEDRDAFGQDLANDMARAAQNEDWPEYTRIKAILYRAT